ncbi:unnamed protein product, partial [Discosporangium mesarthrocarpum]
RTELSLPAPQVSDAELEELVKMGAQAAAAAAGGGGGGTSALVGDYAETMPTPTPMRTPSTPAGENVVMQEARNLARLVSSKTPLLGGENPTLEEGTGFGGSTPRQMRMTTPNTLVARGGAGAGAGGEGGGPPTPGGSTMGTPLRGLGSVLGLNDDTSSLASMSPGGPFGSTGRPGGREERLREKRRKEELRAKLQGLPTPQYDYKLLAPEVEAEAEDTNGKLEEDAADRDIRLAAEQQALEEAEFRKRSQAVKRDLPRPE